MKQNIVDIIIFPFGGNAREAFSLISDINQNKITYNIIGFVDDSKQNINYNNIPVLGRTLLSESPNAFVLAVHGSPHNFKNRKEIFNSLKLKYNRLITLIHPSASISKTARIGKNVLIMAGVVISSDVIIGDHVIILPNSVISHDSVIGDWSIIGSNCSVSGHVNISENCYIGSGTKIIDSCKINKDVLVGLGSVVINNIDNKGTYAGVPARLLKG